MTEGGADRARATAIGMIAVPLWSLLPALTVLASPLPPLELVALTFTIGSLAGFAITALPAFRLRLGALSVGAVAIGIAGLFGFHYCYFLALQNAPPVEATLVNYLWPVLIVVFSTALPPSAGAGRLTIWHLAGALTAFIGAALAITGASKLSLAGNGFGYGMALAAAAIWASYSVATRLFRSAPSSSVAIYSGGTALLAWIAHCLQEPFAWPSSGTQFAAVFALGLGPLGAAFYVWDYGCKKGNIRLLGVSAYFCPILSTIVLIAAGLSSARPNIWLSAIFITTGALLASKDLLFKPSSTRTAILHAP